MLPLRLEMRNFLPYVSPDTIYLEGLHLACLTGNNGAGKSSLLDAITWALWGRARARTEGDLVHLGKEEMHVQLDFTHEGTEYRVVRKRKGGKKSIGMLDFFVMHDGHPKTLNEPSMRATQDKIEQILHLTYDTFVHSAFLQQGKADAFTTRPPAERKRILGEILGLETWAAYEEKAKAKIKSIDMELAGLESTIAEIDEELRQEPQYQRAKVAAQTAFDDAQKALEAAEKWLSEVAHASTDLRNQQEKLAGHEQTKREHLSDEKAVQGEIVTRGQSIERYETTVNQGEAIEAGYTALQQAREVDSSLGEKLSQMSDLERSINQLERDLAAAKSGLESELREFDATIRETERVIQTSTPDELAAVQVQIDELEKLENERDALYEKISKLRENRSGQNATQKTLTEEGKNLNERIERLQVAEGAECPLCGQPLTETHRREILDGLTKERDTLRQNYAASLALVKQYQNDTTENEKRMEALAEELKRLPALRSKAGALERQVEQAHDAQSRLQEAQARRKAVQDTLDQGAFGGELRAELAELNRQREEIGYDRSIHESARDGLKQYQDYDRRHRELEIARNNLPQEQNLLTAARTRLEKLSSSIAREDAAIEELTGEIEKLRLLVDEQRRREEEVRKQRTFSSQAYQRLVSAEQQLAALASRRERREVLETRKENRLKDKAVYEELRYAFGRNGVPAMLIETAIPELEVAANDLLARMTEGRMHLRMTTQREKVTGGVSETLDIEIADDLGTRAYEMYSGGEAFRIDFAIRIALSKMLARRAGSHLETLFIDEGFGTQDDDGRSKLVEAIIAIQSEFKLILVITHIDELRDSFPAHIVVEKGPNGSRVSIR